MPQSCTHDLIHRVSDTMVIGSDERTCLIPPSNLHCSAQDETLSNLPVYETIRELLLVSPYLIY